MDHGSAYLRLSADDSIDLHRSGGTSSKQKDPKSTYSGENLISTFGIVQGEKSPATFRWRVLECDFYMTKLDCHMTPWTQRSVVIGCPLNPLHIPLSTLTVT
jgi:hypothetical protein